MISVGHRWRATLLLSVLLAIGLCSRSKRFLCFTDEVCYDEPLNVGCFDRVSFGRFCQHVYLPMSPETIGPNFTITNSDDPFFHHHINIFNLTDQVTTAWFPRANDVTFIIHGFGESQKLWMRYVRDAIVRLEQQTVILVYWGKGSTHPNYFQAAANTRVVGKIIAKLIETISEIHGIPYDRFRLVGFSLGAHVAGFVGKQFNKTKIGAIYGLDPAGPLFSEGNPNRFYKAVPRDERLDRGDADYVEILHTSGDNFMHAGAGSHFQWGDVDFYANGGEHQPGCHIEYLKFFTFSTEQMMDDFWKTMSCSHAMAYHAFFHSITENFLERHVAFECASKEDWTYGRCVNGETMEFGFKRFTPIANKASPQRKYFFGTLRNGTRGVHVNVEVENLEDLRVPRNWKVDFANISVEFVLQLPAISEHLVLPPGNHTFVAVVSEEHLEVIDGAELHIDSSSTARFTAFGIPRRQWKQQLLHFYRRAFTKMMILWRKVVP
ncbi:hypothetical protein QR680_004339 [Steinernema hermaphroditum]|uniref:Lipase domain-containing protein n=1 Tax=Steinernema hermaphroditum TaxID=289476 RepID=A0AA39HND9_9BILA|nr:hypothetical protein QR680_004339 [Steinernema hermaphroditum]